MLVVMSARKNTVITLSILAGCLVLGYVYAMFFNQINTPATQPTANISVVKNTEPTKDYFEDYRLERDRLRSKQVELLREIINNPNSTSETRSEAQKKMLDIVEKIDTEVQVEKVLVAKGFKDAVVFIRQDNITVIIKSYSLIQQDAEKVKETVSQLTSVSNEDIIVLSKK